MNCPYNRCDGSGLIPLVKNGRTIPHAFTHCDCHPIYGIDVHEHYRPVKPEDFDFPMSWDYWRATCQYNGWPDPGAINPEPIQQEPQVARTEVIHRHSDMSQKDFTSLQQAIRKVENLDRKLKEHIEQSQVRKPAKKSSGYKGLEV